MKTIIYLIFIIIWAVLQARRKALRDAKRKEQESQQAQDFVRQNQPQSTTLGPVTAAENRAQPTYDSTSTAQETPQPSYLDQAPEEVRQFVEAVRPKKKKKQKQAQAADKNDEKVDEIVKPVDLGQDAYSQISPIRREIGFDQASLRKFVVTREVLGPPRSKRPHRPGITQK